MWQVDVRRSLDDAEHAEVVSFIGATGGDRPLSDHLWLDLLGGGRPGFAAAVGRADGRLAAYAQVSAAADGLLLGTAGGTGARRAAVIDAVLQSATGQHVEWWVTDPDDDVAPLAASHGLMAARRLLQMTVPLPIARTSDVATRAFVVGQDEDAWLAVNNAAFAGHPEQGNWDRQTLALRQREPWFDPAGFLLHEREGVLAAFCWTKVHDELDPAEGEIYVIAVDPGFHGLGLGKALTIAGLQHLSRRGLGRAMLYVDAANEPAVGLYQGLGFTIRRVDQAFAGTAR